jgi:hypothetical protein
MALTGHTRLTGQLLPGRGELERAVGRVARDQIEPLGRRILAQERRRVMNVRKHSFEKVTRVELTRTDGIISMHWVIDHPGADIQDRGGTIRARQVGSRLLFKIPGVGWRSPHEVTLPARPWLTPALNRIADRSARILERTISDVLGGVS